MVQVNVTKLPDTKIPVIIPDGRGSETIYAEARFSGKHILLTPAEEYSVDSFKKLAGLGLVVGMTIDTPEHMCQNHPFLDGNGLDDTEAERAFYDVASLHPQKVVYQTYNMMPDPEQHVCQDSECVKVHDDFREQTIGEEAGWGEESEIGQAEEPIDAQIYRLEGEKAKVDVIKLIMHYKNVASDADKLRQIQQVID